MIKTKKQMFTIIGVFTLVMLLGTVSYAFFNYTRTGSANVVRTGQINFSTTQSSGQNGSINLSNVFPIDVTNGVPNNNSNVGEVTINVTGSTEYTGGIEYLVTATNVVNTVNGKTVPISIAVTATSGLGTSDDDYFTDVENSPETSIYKVLAGDTIVNNGEILVGYIKSGQSGVNGNVVIKAYLDADKIAISDTYYENAPTPTPTAPNDEYGTTTEWVDDRVVLTTTEWNGLQSSGLSFKVKVETNEGTWVESPAQEDQISSCPGCYFMYTENPYTFGENGTLISDITETYSNDYNDVITNDRKYFLGFTVNNNRVDRVFACGIKQFNPNQGTPFCIEGSVDGSTYASNNELLYSIYGNACYLNSTNQIICDDGDDDPSSVGAENEYKPGEDYYFDVGMIDVHECGIFSGDYITCF